MTYFVLNYDSLGYFGGQKWGLVSGTIMLYSYLKCLNLSLESVCI